MRKEKYQRVTCARHKCRELRGKCDSLVYEKIKTKNKKKWGEEECMSKRKKVQKKIRITTRQNNEQSTTRRRLHQAH